MFLKVGTVDDVNSLEYSELSVSAQEARTDRRAAKTNELEQSRIVQSRQSWQWARA